MGFGDPLVYRALAPAVPAQPPRQPGQKLKCAATAGIGAQHAAAKPMTSKQASRAALNDNPSEILPLFPPITRQRQAPEITGR